MKRIIVLAALCAFVLSFAAVASAADIKASGAWGVEAVWQDNWGFNDDTAAGQQTKRFRIAQRADTVFEFIANENLKAVLYTRYGAQNWGERSFMVSEGDNGQNTALENRITVRRAYLDFNWPDTTINVKAGYQAMSLPAAFGGGSMILDDEIAGATVSGQITDNVGYLLGYARAYNDDGTNGSGDNYLNQVDAWVAAVPMTFDGFSLTPFGMYAPIGSGFQVNDVTATPNGSKKAALMGVVAQNASDAATGNSYNNAYWLGAAFTMDLFDPFVLAADFNYGKVDSDRKQNEMSGFLFDLALDYKGFDFMTPEVFFAYTSGEDGNASKGNGSSERMPMLSAQNWAIGSFFFGGDTLYNGAINGQDPATLGFWALGLTLKDIQSFAEGLTHTATILYAQGTNDKSVGSAYTTAANQGSVNNLSYGNTLTEEDHLVEVDFNTAYKVYDGLTMTLDLGYINADFDTSVWGQDNKGGDAWKVSTGIIYQF
ncbi:outer membrane homotrimeric porin [Pseudodesulfovibrio sp.]|uniref:outer membrane homotrimeric porin n=1 Tax=unclassified Pseudodesulfovibrio TaxID=2661612 RepID=UPI003B00E9FD